ncbi:hypothetical protein HNQ59_002194 [Chitinivorax tropicus]|uniref:Uncharacterized protein n=1 Tax=Chitinivorax tropicus TaxID=714531 RepID=A0A840MPF2_9PROT|nr:hypothetical protein [Chitinivorax tropicus]
MHVAVYDHFLTLAGDFDIQCGAWCGFCFNAAE